MPPKEIEGYDGMIFVYSCESKDSFDEMMLYYIKIQALYFNLIPRIVLCNKMDKFEEVFRKNQG